jgi:hypothetical protein
VQLGLAGKDGAIEQGLNHANSCLLRSSSQLNPSK